MNTAAMNTLSNAEAIHISTVLEDCIDQLVILGRIMPVPYQKRPDAEQVCTQHSKSNSSRCILFTELMVSTCINRSSVVVLQ